MKCSFKGCPFKAIRYLYLNDKKNILKSYVTFLTKAYIVQLHFLIHIWLQIFPFKLKCIFLVLFLKAYNPNK